MHRTNGETYLPIQRGTNSLKIRVSWLRGCGAGYLRGGANLWEDAGGRPGKLIRSFCIFTNYCYRVEPYKDFVPNPPSSASELV
jgi:hypothetical protein